MSAQAVVTVSASVILLVQVLKWAGLPQDLGPLAVLLVAALGVGVYRVSLGGALSVADAWPLFAGWVAVAASAAGVFGFVREAPAALAAFRRPSPKSPPAGPGTGRP